MKSLWISCGMLLVAMQPASAQKLPKWKIDPFTKNEPEAMERAGYVSYGPFEFGMRGSQPATTQEIQERLDYANFLWVETEHFRIGSSLRAWRVANDQKTRTKIRAELEELQKRLPSVNPRARVLSPWLRLHLFAQRMENAYEEFRSMIGVPAEDFPRDKDEVIAGYGRFLGYGPYLGMPEKFVLLMTDKTGPYQEYMESFIGKGGRVPQRWHFMDAGILFFGTAVELGQFKHDTALHSHVVFNMMHNFVDGFRGYAYDVPVWITEGLGHWAERRVDPRWNSFSQSESTRVETNTLWRWEQETRKLIAAGQGTPFSEAYKWRDYGNIEFDDHILLWSRWDYLMTFGNEKFSEFMFHVKGRIHPETWATDQNDLVGATREALREVYGLTPLTLDEKWKEWVMENYAAR